MSAPPASNPGEAEAVRDRYARRDTRDARYHPLNPAALLARQERERAIVRLFARHGVSDPGALRLLEVGCGDGGVLLDLLRLGFQPERVAGIELLPERHAMARQRLPGAVTLWVGDATALDPGAGEWDVVVASTVFSSLLDDAFQQRLADAMWAWLRPGGAVLWVDFSVDNPRNPDVRGVPLSRLRALFPQGRVDARRITLAPPLARLLCRVHPALATLFNLLPLLRTHRLAWIEKPL